MPKLRNQVTVTGQAGSLTAIAASQSVLAGAATLINGVLALTGQAIPSNLGTVSVPGGPYAAGQILQPGSGLPTSGTAAVLGPAQPVIIASAGNDSAATFTIVGSGPSGEQITEKLAGANIGNVYSITPSANTAAAITVGTGAVVYSPWFIMGAQRNNYGTNLEAFATGTVSYDVQATSDPNLMINSGGQADDIATLQAAKTATQLTVLAQPWIGVRVKMNSGTGTVILRAMESRTA